MNDNKYKEEDLQHHKHICQITQDHYNQSGGLKKALQTAGGRIRT